ncbi:MAG: rod-binding protein [Candidatus Neomarinimicrobiota bacterium]
MDIVTKQPLAVDSTKTGGDLKNEKSRELQLRAKSRDLEAVFISQLFKAMEKTIDRRSEEGSDNNLSTMMFSSTMGKAVAEQGGIGLADMIYRSLTSQENAGRELPTPVLDEIELLSKIQYLRPRNE